MTMSPRSTAPAETEAPASDLDEQLQAEHGLARGIIIGVLVAVPISVGVLMGLIYLAVSDVKTGLGGPLAMAAAVGVLTGLFFGSWAGFVSNTHAFEELDRKANLRRRSPRP